MRKFKNYSIDDLAELGDQESVSVRAKLVEDLERKLKEKGEFDPEE